MSSIGSATAGLSLQQSFNTAPLKKPAESNSTRNNDGTYGPRHTVDAPPAADKAQELAVAEAVLNLSV